ncbi:hypothetical protein [Desulfovibrio sp. SGI.169]|uniref:hypothetical protein n=1 Tax=Desulfovibrio sp. SGI.169 TaxID=3420561 RepID=UPI003D027EDE
MNKKLFILSLLFLGSIGLCGNAGANPQGERNIVQMTASGKSYSCEGVLFKYGENDYNIRDIVPAINSIMACSAVGKYIVVDGHVNPMWGVYLIFNTETKRFEKGLEGANLIWRDDDISTAVYSSISNIYSYDGKILANIDIPDNAFIRELSFSENNAYINVIVEFPDKTQTILVPIHGEAK